MRPWLVAASLFTTLSAGIAVAQSPVAYVYVAEQTPQGSTTSPITAYAASSSGTLTPLSGSPFKQTSGFMAGTNGSHFITMDHNGNTTHQYLHVYNVGSNGVIGSQTASQDLHQWCAMDEGAEYDHTGQFIYVADDPSCGRGYQSFALSKSGQLTFEGSLTVNYADVLQPPVFSGNDQFAYTWVPGQSSQPACPVYKFLGLGRESSGALQNISFTETDPLGPAGYTGSPLFGYATPDPTNHLAALLQYTDASCSSGGTVYTRLASYTVQSNGDLVSTNTWDQMPALAGYTTPSPLMKLNPAGSVLAVAVGTGIQFFHFNGAAPITNFTGIIGKSGYISAMAWDKANHLYALNAKSGKLHVYTVTSTGVVEAAGSPYLPPNTCSTYCSPQTLIVRIIPGA